MTKNHLSRLFHALPTSFDVSVQETFSFVSFFTNQYLNHFDGFSNDFESCVLHFYLRNSHYNAHSDSEFITHLGKLLMTGEAFCNKKVPGALRRMLKRPKIKESIVFIFKESVIICEKVTSDQPYTPSLIQYWVGFQVNFVFYFLKNSLKIYYVRMHL